MVESLKQFNNKKIVELELEIVPNSKQFSILGFSPWTNALKIKVKEKPLKGQANKELERELEKLFQAKTQIISGNKSRKKKILVTGITAPQISRIIENAAKT